MRALIIDDERLARSALRRLLSAHPEVKIIGEAANPDEAIRAIDKTSPDVLFLDVEMPGGSGFDLLEKLEDVPAVIFTTAYDEYAVRAFEVSAARLFGEADHRTASGGGLRARTKGLGRDS